MSANSESEGGTALTLYRGETFANQEQTEDRPLLLGWEGDEDEGTATGFDLVGPTSYGNLDGSLTRRVTTGSITTVSESRQGTDLERRFPAGTRTGSFTTDSGRRKFKWNHCNASLTAGLVVGFAVAGTMWLTLNIFATQPQRIDHENFTPYEVTCTSEAAPSQQSGASASISVTVDTKENMLTCCIDMEDTDGDPSKGDTSPARETYTLSPKVWAKGQVRRPSHLHEYEPCRVFHADFVEHATLEAIVKPMTGERTAELTPIGPRAPEATTSE